MATVQASGDGGAVPGALPGGVRWGQSWRAAALGSGLLVYSAVAAGGVSQTSRGAGVLAGYLLIAAFSVVLCALGVMAARAPSPPGGQGQRAATELSDLQFWLPFAVMSALFVAALPFARADGFFLAAVLAALVVVRTRRASPWVVGALAAAGLAVPWAVGSWRSGPGWIQALDIVFTALVSYSFSELIRANQALREARAEIARLATEGERNRIARDLHDLLGHSLTAITVKAGLAHRLASSDPTRARREIGEVEKLSRQALTEVRAAVSTYRNVTLAAELAQGRELLRASGVVADLPTATDMVDAAHQEVLAWAVREGLTNVARHARATRCTVILSASEVEIRDDGVGGAAGDGHGLAGLRERVAAAGGIVEAGPLTPRGWRLRVSLDPAAGGRA
jgi:two-component system sensor histidine kinase DesK